MFRMRVYARPARRVRVFLLTAGAAGGRRLHARVSRARRPVLPERG